MNYFDVKTWEPLRLPIEMPSGYLVIDMFSEMLNNGTYVESISIFNTTYILNLLQTALKYVVILPCSRGGRVPSASVLWPESQC